MNIKHAVLASFDATSVQLSKYKYKGTIPRPLESLATVVFQSQSSSPVLQKAFQSENPWSLGLLRSLRDIQQIHDLCRVLPVPEHMMETLGSATCTRLLLATVSADTEVARAM